MKLLIDAGNTRIKWAVTDPQQRWLEQGVLPHEQLMELNRLLRRYTVTTGWVSCVASDLIRSQIKRMERNCRQPFHFIRAVQQQCGVYNAYEHPDQLGADRWAALIAARHMHLQAALVINCGTATTIDWLDHQGVFRGGLIVPGVSMMQQSLVERTALPAKLGQWQPWPRNTADAMTSGAIQATCGVIHRQLQQVDGEVDIILSGGAAGCITPYLASVLAGHSIQQIDNLVLQGLNLIAQEQHTLDLL